MKHTIILFLLVSFLSTPALAHRLDGSNYSGHDASLCGYANENLGGSVSCSDPAANPCNSGRSTSSHTPNSRGHSHAGFPANKEQTQACQDYLARLNPPPPVVTPPPTCDHGEACDGYGAHQTSDHDCESCDEQDGTCGWHSNHRHPDQCPNAVVDSPPPPCAHGDACDGWGEHEEAEHLCDACDDRDGTCGWLDGHRHPGQCANDPNWEPPEDTPADPPADPPECPACPICLSCPYVPPCPEPRIEFIEYCPVKPPQWGTDSWY